MATSTEYRPQRPARRPQAPVQEARLGGIACLAEVSLKSMEECIHALDMARVIALELQDRGVGEVTTENIDDSLEADGGDGALQQQCGV